ncbi:unnamed protein product [Clavelina lepadiformis]|uniref:HECT-type E3 ubiquitin transferase n=1 Tax=Clavelina lepadiformis TaxID=159417 RepID=A0ABP0GKU3_CLALP
MFTAEPSYGKGGSVVEKARIAREERAHQRQRELAAIKIQSYARGYFARCAVATRWREELDNLMGWDAMDTKSTQQNNTSDQNSTNFKKPDGSASATDYIPAHTKQVSTEEWRFASFGINKLTGAYSNLSIAKSNSAEVAAKNETLTTNNQNTIEQVETNARPISPPIALNNGIQENYDKFKNAMQSQNLPQVKQVKKVSGEKIFKIVKQFLFIYNYKRDRERFLELCKYLVYNTESESSLKYSYVALCIHKQLVLPWIEQIKLILWECCKTLDQTQKSSENLLLSPYLKMLVLFTDVSNWKVMKKQSALLPVLSQVCTSISSELFKQGCLCVIGSLLNKRITTMDSGLISACIVFTIRVITASNFSDESLTGFMSNMLTVPALIWHLTKKLPQCVAFLHESCLISHLIALFHVEGACQRHGVITSCSSSRNVIDVLCVVANLVQLLVADIETTRQKRAESVALLNQLLKFLCKNTAGQSMNISTWHPVLGYFSGNATEHTEAMQFVRKQLQFLWEPSFVKVVFHDVLTLKPLHDETSLPAQAEQISTKTKSKTKLADKFNAYLKRIASSRPQMSMLPTGGRKLEYAEVKNTCCGCLLYRRALTIVTKQLALEMLTGLTFMDEVLCRMWRFICEIGPSGGLQLFLSSLTLPPDIAEPYFAVFTLFCDMTAHILSILDDIEFYEQQIPFHLEELVTISAFLKQFVFKAIWSRIVKDSQSSMYYVFDSAHTLLMMLYDRDARRSFTPQNHWLCKDIKPSTIRGEVEKSQPRAKLVVEKIPFVLPHKERVILFRSFISADRASIGITDEDISAHIRVHRSRLVDDGYTQLKTLSPASMKGVIRVKFVNDLGLDEAGIDQDGVFKEFLEEIITKVFNPDMNLFKVTSGEESKLYPSPLSHLQDDHLDLFAFIGRMLGKAVYEGIVLDIPFANFFLRNLLSQQHTKLYSPIDELPSLDSEFYKNLTWIKRYEGDISDLGLSFTYEEDAMGKVESHDLVPGGSAIAVTNENRIMYIHTLAHYRLHTQIRQQTRAFVSGFRSIISHSWTTMFSAPELQRLISGDNIDLDLTDLKRHVVYYGGFHSSHRVVRWLWDILERDYTAQDRAGFLKFVTSCSRPPLLGFAHLQPQFSIRCVEVPDDEDTGDTMATVLRGFFRLSSSKSRRSQQHPHRLPTASTCFNLLKLPNYPNKEILKEKLKQAIANNTGFELS